MTEISVIIPAYNRAEYITKAIHSVYNQTFTDWELILVDDGSTDDTPKILTGFQDPRLHVITQANKGVSAARNTGIRHSSGPFVTFLDADDWFMPDQMSMLHSYLDANPQVGLVAGKMAKTDLSGSIIYADKGLDISQISFPGLLTENNLAIGSMMIRRKWLECVGGFDESMHYCEDWDLWLRLVLAGCQLSCVDKLVVTYRTHPGQATQNVAKIRTDTLYLWEKFFKTPNLPSDLLAYRNLALASALIRTSAHAFRIGEYEMGNSDLLEAVKLDPDLSHARYKRLVELLKGWANNPQIPDPEAYLLAISNHVTLKLPGLRHQLRKATAALLLERLFGTSKETWRTQRKALLRAILYDPSWLANRGILRMIIDAWFIPSRSREA